MTHRVTVVGGGIAGLAAAYRLRQAVPSPEELELTVAEARPTLGGTVGTERRDGFVCEAGPDSFLTAKPEVVALVRELGLERRLVGVRSRKVYLVHRRRLVPLPEGFAQVATPRLTAMLRTPLLSPWGKLRALGDLVRPPNRSARDESVSSFVERRFGREVLDRLAGPLVAGLHAADPARLSAESLLPQFRAFERQYGSVLRGLRASRRNARAPATSVPTPFASFVDGMQELPDALVRATPATSWKVGVEVEGVDPERSGGFTVRGTGDERWSADAVLLAAPAPVAARTAERLHVGLATALGGIRYASSVTVTLAFPVEACRIPEGTGFLVARDERMRLRACTWASSKFPNRAPAGQVLLRAFYGGSDDEEVVEWPEERLVERAIADLGLLIALRGPPTFSRVHRWRRTHPQYEVGHATRVAAVEAACAEVPGLFVAGSAYHGVGIPDCVRDAESAARAVLTYLR